MSAGCASFVACYEKSVEGKGAPEALVVVLISAPRAGKTKKKKEKQRRNCRAEVAFGETGRAWAAASRGEPRLELDFCRRCRCRPSLLSH